MFLAYFASKGFYNLYGIEPSTELIKNIPANIAEVKTCTAEKIAYEDAVFDVVFIYGVLHHLKGVDSYKASCNEIYRVLKPGGFLFLMEPGRYRIFRAVEVASKFMGRFSKKFRAFSECLEEEKPEQHFFLKNHGIIRESMIRKGFKIIVDDYFIYSWIFTAQKSKDGF